MEIVIATGGTGGHLYPALALAEEARDRGIRVRFILGHIKQGVVAQGITGARVSSGPLSGVSLSTRAISVFKIAWGTLRCLGLIRDAPLIAFGSYASLPALLAARLKRSPYWLMEQNVIPGATVKAFAKYARAVFTTFGETANYLPGARCVRTGNPLRKGLRSLDREEARAHWGFDRRPVVLVLGGSQGARALTNASLDMAKTVKKVQFLVIAGRRDFPSFRERYPERGDNYALVDYVPDMSLAYSAADIAVARSGGAVSQELAFFGLPGILVPFPYAAGNHQLANARALERIGGALVLEEKDMDRLPGTLLHVLENPDLLKEMSRGIRAFHKPRAAAEVLDAVIAETTNKKRSDSHG